MSFRWERSWIGAYLDGELGPMHRWLLRQRLLSDRRLFEEYDGREAVGDVLKELREVPDSAGLRTRIRLAVSHEQSGGRWPRWKVRLQNFLRPLAIPATGGVLSAVVLFLSLMSHLWFSPRQWVDDVPLRYLATAWVSHPTMSVPSPFGVTEKIGVEAFVDAHGRVYDFHLIQFPAGDPGLNSALKAQLANVLLTAQFTPATSFGRPVPGRILISFRPVEQVYVVG